PAAFRLGGIRLNHFVWVRRGLGLSAADADGGDGIGAGGDGSDHSVSFRIAMARTDLVSLDDPGSNPAPDSARMGDCLVRRKGANGKPFSRTFFVTILIPENRPHHAAPSRVSQAGRGAATHQYPRQRYCKLL